MNRRDFLTNGAVVFSGTLLSSRVFGVKGLDIGGMASTGAEDLFKLFSAPDTKYRPFIRWWWNGDKIEKKELARELRLLKDVGIGGVEINPIAFPDHGTDHMGIRSLEYLSDEWIDMLKFTFDEAKSLGMYCDLIAGTGFPFGGEFLKGEERTQIAVIGVKKIEGPLNTEFSLFDLLKEADPPITNAYTGRKLELLSVKLVPDPLKDMEDVKDVTNLLRDDVLKISIPAGKHAIYSLVKIIGFEKVIVGAPGGKGPVLNHLNKDAVSKYLHHISDTIQNKIGPLAPHLRSFFVDSMELEGANWDNGMLDEFRKRRGYDIAPYLPFVLFRIGGMGNNQYPAYVIGFGDDLHKDLVRMRYDWAQTIAEVFQENFVNQFAKWCTDNGVKSRAQAYGRGYFLLEGSFSINIPECETWLKYGIGKDISETDFMRYPWHLGQGNTMINKYVSSAAHLKDKRLISSEELTNTDMVFNESLELFKIAGDQSTISGVTHPVFHGFNYSPPDAPFPGWIRWGGYFNEKNTIWPFLHYYTDYRARLSALLQQGTMFGDIALLPAIPDMWSELGAQNEPFPTTVYPKYQMLIWEAIHQNGSGCDYVSEGVINDAKVEKGSLVYGNRRYSTIFLIEVKSINPETVEKLHNFVSSGGKILCIEAIPDRSPGWKNHEQRDIQVRDWISRMKKYPDRFIFLNTPPENFCEWITEVQKKHHITPYVQIASPRRYITQVRYQMSNSEVFLFTNSSDSHVYQLRASFDKRILKNREPWLWDAETGERFRLKMTDGNLSLPLGPASSAIIVFDKSKIGNFIDIPPLDEGPNALKAQKPWDVKFKHYDGAETELNMDVLTDLKDIPDYAHFAGEIRYINEFEVNNPDDYKYINLGNVYGISILRINGRQVGVKWYGNRIFRVQNVLQKGKNVVEIVVVTVMVNYIKTLKDNKIAQYWTNQGRKDQPLQSLGLVGPVNFF